MFDEIVIPKSYLKGLLTKGQEKLLTTAKDYGGNATGVVFQTKSLDNQLGIYKLYRQKLYKNERFEDNKWSFVEYTGEIYCWDGVKDKKGDYYWIEFRFVFLKGKIDSKSLEDFKVNKTAKQIEDENRKWEISKAKQDDYEKTLKYRFYFSVFKVLSKVVNRLRTRLSPYEYEYGTVKQNELSD